jgi:1-phosphofructokinase family hexose kinase
MAGQLRALRLPHEIIPLRTPTRVNVIVTPEHGRQVRFNPVWARLSGREWLRIRRTVLAALLGCDWLVLSGSLPGGAPVDAYAVIIRQAHRRGVRCVLDCEGPALRAALAARPFLVKPNTDELAAWCGRTLASTASVLTAARELASQSGGWVLVSRGSRGALLVNEREACALSAAIPTTTVRNTVGAGDALVAAVVERLCAGAAPEDWLRAGVATGTAAVGQPAGRLPAGDLIRRLARCVSVAPIASGTASARQHR